MAPCMKICLRDYKKANTFLVGPYILPIVGILALQTFTFSRALTVQISLYCLILYWKQILEFCIIAAVGHR
jgi:hypothetical protein